MSKNGGIIGVSDHGGWAVLVTVACDGTLLDRRRVELVDNGLPKLPHHSEGQRLPLDEAVELVERVRVSAESHAVLALDAVTMAVPHIFGIALRNCPQRTIVRRTLPTGLCTARPLRPRHGLGPSTGTTQRAYWLRLARRCV
jgi:hypothetical protein